ncbi:MAG: hypothetical protein ACE5EM_05585 [Sphingomonadales bacterium]
MAAPKKKEVAYLPPAEADPITLIEDAKEVFYKDPNVIGVGIGHHRKDGETHEDEVALIVYVKEKLARDDVTGEFLIPDEFQGMGTDVVAPFGPDTPLEALGFSESHQNSDDMSFIDWGRLHEQWTLEAGGEVAFQGKVQAFGDVCVIEDDGTLVKTINGRQVVDFVRAYKMFRTTQPDIYDFVTFVTDTASGMPPQGGSSWYRFVHNDTQGIGLGNFNYRAAYGTNKLQGIIFLNQGHFPLWRYVMLQEQGHRWGCFSRYRDAANGPNLTDHMLGGWGHWMAGLDDDRSPMDYDIHDWKEEGNNRFRRITLNSEQRTYCNLDLYLMGLLGPHEVGDISLLSNITNISGNLFSADEKRLTTENFIWAEGPRSPSASTSQKLFKNGFLVVTKDLTEAHDLVDEVDRLRLRFEEDFFEATKTLGRVDTSIGPLQAEMTPSQVRQLTSRRYTTLHRHHVRPADMRITGTQFTGALNPGQSRTWFTYNWSPRWLVEWSIRPTTSRGKVSWSERIERAPNGTLTYWITVRNVGSVRTRFEAKYARLR